MGSEPDEWMLEQPQGRPRSFTMLSDELEATLTKSYAAKPKKQDASMQGGKSPAPMQATQEGQSAGDPTDKQESQEAPADVPQDPGIQSVGQVVKEHPFEEMLATAEDIGDGVPQSKDEGDSAPSQETTEGHHVAHIPQESEMMDNEKNARLAAEMGE